MMSRLLEMARCLMPGRLLPHPAGAPRHQHWMDAPESFTSAAHFGPSAVMYFAKSAGDPICASPLNCSRLAFASALLSPSVIGGLVLSMIAAGVPAGASTPQNAIMVKSGKPLSTMVGTFGSSGQ